MQYLLYCIFENSRRRLESLHGVDDPRVFFVTGSHLTAAVSRLNSPALSLDVSHILAYEKVIASLHRERTVIPMRYGCLFEKEAQIVRLLGERHQEYGTLLRELEGCVEMGIRILPTEVLLTIPAPSLYSSRLSSDYSSGKAYLARKRDRYAAMDQMSLQHARIVEKIRRTLAGLFVRSTSEFSSWGGSPAQSLCFLVTRNSVARFKKAFRHNYADDSTRLLLTGPWPPYNFVTASNGSPALKEIIPGRPLPPWIV
ncbi:MAG: GvpL/GvpF family gas vesicle protein [Acidobacteria bacterium]|nr:GvpL/GvpF family gas vesicle protein [Acidobacteriota bacterium]